MLPGLTSAEQHAFSRYRLLPRRRGRGNQGERLTSDPGRSQEFRDFREYADGDDLRHLDWNVLARLGHRVVRNYQDEQELKVTMILDATASMGPQEGPKWQTVLGAASALGLVALQGGDALQGFALGGGDSVRPLRGAASLGRWAGWLQGLSIHSSGASLSRGCQTVASALKSPGLTILLSDGLEEGAEVALRSLARRGQEIWLVQILTQEEMDPALTGDLELEDVDSGQVRVCTITETARAGYLQNLHRHNDVLHEACRKGGGRAMIAEAGSRPEALLREVWCPMRWLG